MKKVFVFLCLFFSFYVFTNIKTHASSLIYQINLQDRYTVSASIIKIINSGAYSNDDLPTFYSILSYFESIDNNTRFTSNQLNDILLEKGLSFTNSSVFTIEQYKTETYYNYDYFNVNQESKSLYIKGTVVNYIYIPDGTVKRFTGLVCPIGWDVYDGVGQTYSVNGEELITPLAVTSVTCKKIGTESSYSETTTINEVTSRTFTTRNTQMTSMFYGFGGYLGIPLDFNPEVFILLLDDDKLLIWDTGIWNGDITSYPTYSISKYEHFKLREEKNAEVAEIETEIDAKNNNFREVGRLATYFHFLARYNGDTLYQNNKKYVCSTNLAGETYEIIFDNDGNRINDPLVKGTYNFFDSDYNTKMHLIADVYPYLIWGNSKFDDSTIYERFIWNADAYEWGSAGSLLTNIDLYDYLFKYRDQLLLEKGSSKIFDIYSNLQLIENQLNYYL